MKKLIFTCSSGVGVKKGLWLGWQVILAKKVDLRSTFWPKSHKKWQKWSKSVFFGKKVTKMSLFVQKIHFLTIFATFCDFFGKKVLKSTFLTKTWDPGPWGPRAQNWGFWKSPQIPWGRQVTLKSAFKALFEYFYLNFSHFLTLKKVLKILRNF